MKIILVSAFAFCTLLVNAQITSFVNGNSIKQGDTISEVDISTLAISFKNVEEPILMYGKVGVYVTLRNSYNKYIDQWMYEKDGITNIDNFINNTPEDRQFDVFNEKDLQQAGNNLDYILNSSQTMESRRLIKVEVNVFFSEKTGYKQYADATPLVEPFEFILVIGNESVQSFPYANLKLDRSKIEDKFDLVQSGRLSSSSCILLYKSNLYTDLTQYTIFTVDAEKTGYSGITTQEVARNFIYRSAYLANSDYDYKEKFNEKGGYYFDWDLITGLDYSFFHKNLSKKVDKKILKKDLIDAFFTEVEVNSMKGYVLAESTNIDNSYVVTYILEHPTDSGSVLIVSSNFTKNSNESISELDAHIKNLLGSIIR